MSHEKKTPAATVPPSEDAHLSEDPLTDPEPRAEDGLADWLPVAVPADGDGPLP